MSDQPTDEGAGTRPGSAGSGLGGPMETGPQAGAGPGGAEDPPRREGEEEQSLDGPAGSQDSSLGDLDEAGD